MSWGWVLDGIEIDGHSFGTFEAGNTTINLVPDEKITQLVANDVKTTAYGSPKPLCNFIIVTTMTTYGPFGKSPDDTDCDIDSINHWRVHDNEFLEFLQKSSKNNEKGWMYITNLSKSKTIRSQTHFIGSSTLD